MNQVIEFFKKLFDSTDWPARWHCGTWTDFHGWLYLISDLLIWSAYFTIPIVILRYTLKKQGIRSERLYLLFAGFILACGATHFLDAVAFWVPLYRLSALVRFITAVIGWATIFYLIKLLPTLFSMKSQAALEAEILQRKQAENRFKILLEATPDALIIANKNGVITLANHQTEHLFGYTNSELTGKSMDILMSEPYGRAYALFSQPFFLTPDAIATDKKFELCGVRQNGNEFPAEVNISTFKIEDELNLCVAFRDISKRKKQEKELKEMANIIATSSDAIISKSLDGTVLTWNNGAEKTFGYSLNEIKGMNISLLFPPELLHEEKINTQKILDGEKIEQYETVRVRKNQSRINVSITLNAIRNETDEVVGISIILRDITQQKKAELELQQSNKRNQIFIQQSPHAIAMFDNKMRYLAASRKWVIDYKLEGREILGRTHYEIFPEIGDDWKAIHQACLQGEVNQCDEAMFERADGSVQWLTWDVRPWYVSDDNIGGLIMYTADITHIKEKDAERKRIETILEISNSVARISTFEIDPVTEKINISPIANEIFEFPENYQPDYPTLVSHYKKGERFNRLLRAMQVSMVERTPYDLEVEIVTAKGNDRWLRMIGHAEFRNDVCVKRFGIIQDITKSKKIEEELNFLNEKLNNILNAGHVSIIGADNNGLITHFSKGAEILLQYTAEEVIGIKTPVIIHLEDEIVERGKELSLLYNQTISGNDVFTHIPKQGEFESREWTYVRKDGSTFPVQLVVSSMRDAEGNVIGFLGIATDISVIKKAEKEMKSLLQITTDQKDRLKNFAHIVSHNLRSHSGNIEMILNLYLDSDPAAATNTYISLLKTSSGNLKETIANLNEVVLINTSSEIKLTPINLHHTINVAANNVGQLATQASVTIINNTHKDFSILGLPAYVDSILLNFISNGIKYRSPDRDCYVKLSASVQNHFLVLTIKDNGLGIDLKRNGAKLFGMYKTFHGNADARGIGLFITKNQVEAIGGKIEVESEVDKGTTFSIWFQLDKSAKNEAVLLSSRQ